MSLTTVGIFRQTSEKPTIVTVLFKLYIKFKKNIIYSATYSITMCDYNN